MILFLVFLHNLLDCVLSRTIPPYVHLCKMHDPELGKCIIKTAYEIRPYLYNGIPEMNIPPTDPLHISNLTVDTGSTSTTNIHIVISNLTISGLLDIDVRKFDADIANGRFSGILNFQRLRIQGNYKIRGKIILLEVNSEGYADLNATDVSTDVEWQCSFYIKKNERYMRFEQVKVKLNTGAMNLHFDNLFNGNEELTASLNKAINDNVESLQADLNPIAEETIGKLTVDYFNGPHNLFPVNQLYLE